VEVGRSLFESSPDKVIMKLYLKSKLKTEGLGIALEIEHSTARPSKSNKTAH
jgi:DUF1680 family protein